MKQRTAMQNPGKDSAQAELDFSMPAEPVAEAVRAALVAALKNSGLSREEVALRMSGIVGRQITATMLNDCCAASQPHRFPAEWMPALYKVTGDLSVFHAISDAHGLPRLDPELIKDAEYGRTKLEIERLEEIARCQRTTVLRNGGAR